MCKQTNKHMTQQNIKEWVSKIIESCKDDFQFEAVDRLIDLYYIKYADEDGNLELQLERARKWNEVHQIIEPTLNK